MVLLGDGGRENRNLVRGKAHQEKAMKIEYLHLGLGRFHPEIEMEKEKGQQNEEIRRAHQEIEREVGIGREEGTFDEEEKEGIGGGEKANGQEGVGVEEINNSVGGSNTDMPTVDDVCPICFDRFTVPCRSNCGHWFCASCILQFWMFRSSIQPCKCPLCCCRIVNLKPEISQLIQPASDTRDVLKKVHQYNGLYISGVLGAFHRVLAFPLLLGRIFRFLIHPDGLRCIYYVMRVLGLFLALLYERGEFEFMPTGMFHLHFMEDVALDTGGLGIQRMFDMSASFLILIFFLIGIVYRWTVRGRARRLAAIRSWDP